MFFPLFQSDRTPEECALWCNDNPVCYAFVTVVQSVRPGVAKCWRKSSLTFPNSYQNQIGTSVYYKLAGGFNVKECKTRHNLNFH